MRRLIYIGTVGAALAAASPALAKDPPVFVDPDPDSPAGTEYAIPLDKARDEADGDSGRSTGAAPLFGEGISRSDQAAGSTAGSGDDGSGGGAGGSGSGRSGSGPGGSDSDSNIGAIPAASEQGGSSTGLTIGIPLAVLALGGGIALVVFSVRSLRAPPAP